MFRFLWVIITHFITGIHLHKVMKKALKANASNNDKYNVAHYVAKTITKKSNCNVYVSGLEELPNEDGYVLYSNHQGRYDALGIFATHPRMLSVVLDEARSDVFIEGEFVDLVRGERLDKKNAKASYLTLKKVEERVKNKENFLIFPEGFYSDNKNKLQEFHTGCMHLLKETHAPIVPVCLYDTYKVFNKATILKVSCSICYLKPIYYDEYKDKSYREIAEMIKSTIQDKINELGNNK